MVPFGGVISLTSPALDRRGASADPSPLPRLGKSHHVSVERHLEAACARCPARAKRSGPFGLRPRFASEKGLGDLTEELEAIEDQRQAVADKTRRDLDLQVEVWGGGVAAITQRSQQLATANALSNVNTDRARFHVCVEEVDAGADAQRHVVAGEPCEGRRFWIVRRR